MSGTAAFWAAQYGGLALAPAGETRPATGREGNAIGAASDAEAVQLYIEAKRFTPERTQVFLTELARWSWFLAKLGSGFLGEANLSTVQAYDRWLLTPASEHNAGDVGPRAPLFLPDGRFNPCWRPFKPGGDGLSVATVEWSLSLLRGFYAWLKKGKYLDTNPFSLVAPRKRTDDAKPGDVAMEGPASKALTLDTLLTIGDYINGPSYRGSEYRRAADRWLLQLLFETGHRAAAAAALTDEHLVPVTTGVIELSVRGKGSKALRQEWTPALQAGLEQYRAALGLAWLPARPGICTAGCTTGAVA